MDAESALLHIDELEASLDELRRVADHASDLPPALLEPEVAEAVSVLRGGFIPEEAFERRLASALGGAGMAEFVRMSHREVHRRLDELVQILDTVHQSDDASPDPGLGARLARALHGAEALAGAQLASERWLLAHVGRPERAAEAGATHCEWCGAEYPVPG